MAATANVFALLGGDGDDDIQQLAEKAAPLIKEKAAPAPAPAATKPEPRADAGRGGRGGAGRGDRGGRGGRGGRGPREAPLANGVEDPVGEERGEGGRGRGYGGRGRGRGRGGYDSASRPPRREYERRDGTGRGHEVQKRGGAGVGNWGTAADDSKEPAPAEEVKVEGEEVPAEPPAEGAAEAPAEPQPEPEPEVKEMTLEEYEKQLAEKRAALNKVAEVKSVSQDDFKGMKAYVRKDAEETIPGLEVSKKKAEKAAKAAEEAKDKPKKQVNTIETGFRLPEPEAGGRGRGGRGPRGGRGGDRGDRGDRPFSGGRGQGRGREGGRGQGRGGGRELPINDAQAFPSLG